MEDYPSDYIEHELPLILLSGLGKPNGDDNQTQDGSVQESGTKLSIASPECRSDRTAAILDQVLSWDGSKQPWNAIALPSSPGLLKYRFLPVGRSYTLPPRKAAPLPQSPSTDGFPSRHAELHSPLSPLSPGSPVFPDGIMTPLWFHKHRQQIPALIVCFFDFNVDGGSMQDETIKSDINSIRTALTRSGFRTRLAAVLISDRSIIQSPQMDDRLSSIRRATNLDSKNGIFFMPPMPSDGETATYIQSMLTTLQPVCIEHYRDLTKHARRKKARSAVPTSPTIPTRNAARQLPVAGWNARYEVKQGIFAEFRQEMDVAERHYSQALDDLCNVEGVFNTTPNWSPRWNETRLLCDSLAARILRCHLWNGMTTTAAITWFHYRARMKNLVDTKGRGSDSYGWLAWDSRWATVMAQLVAFAELSTFDAVPRPKNEPPIDQSDFHIYARPDRIYQNAEKIMPFHHLHHAGYWQRRALKSARARHATALLMPEEDRVPPGQSPASTVAQRAQAYDTFLVPEPHEESASAASTTYIDDLHIAELTQQASDSFLDKGQRRFSEKLRFDLAVEYANIGLYDRAIEILVPLWDSCSWREETWTGLLSRLLALLNKCATALKNAEIALATAWELLSIDNVSPDDLESSIHRSLDGIDLPGEAKVSMSFSNTDRLSPISVGFAFDADQAFSGEPVKCQLVIQCYGQLGMQALGIAEIRLSCESARSVVLRQSKEKASTDTEEITSITLQDSPTELSAEVDLSMKPGSRRIFDFAITFKEARTTRISEVIARIEGERYRITHNIDDAAMLQLPSILNRTKTGLDERLLRQLDSTELVVLPKPPKVEITFGDLQDQYFVGQSIHLKVELINGESRAVSGNIKHEIITEIEDTVVPSQLKQGDGNDDSDATRIRALAADDTLSTILHIQPQDAVRQFKIAFSFEYTLDGDDDTPLTKTIELNIKLDELVEVKWSFGPLLDLEPWPSYFDTNFEETTTKPSGIPQRWQASFAGRLVSKTPIKIHESALQINEERRDAVVQCKSSSASTEVIAALASFDRSFELTTQKVSADDRRPLSITPMCSVIWSHGDTSERFTTYIPVPRITLPSSEPRVLCTTLPDKTNRADTILRYSLENLSTHFLTFAITMQASEDFAFMGAKYRTLSLAPLSRLFIDYGILLHDRDGVVIAAGSNGRWIQPSLQVLDSYYHKNLRVQAAGSGVKMDSKNVLTVWVEKLTEKRLSQSASG